jgi:hypothetical protein
MLPNFKQAKQGLKQNERLVVAIFIFQAKLYFKVTNQVAANFTEIPA